MERRPALPEGATFDPWPMAWVRFNRWTAALCASTFLQSLGAEPVVRLRRDGLTWLAMPYGLAWLRERAAEAMADDLAEWVADGLPVKTWPSSDSTPPLPMET